VLSGIAIDALSEGCAKCGGKFANRHLCCASYTVNALKSFEFQIELGIIGAGVRNFWVHTDCDKKTMEEWNNMTPDIHICVKCKKQLQRQDVVQPVFQVTNPREQNPLDPEDVGIALNDRVYFLHSDCANPGLNRHAGNILLL
jgi:hypothetical protein